MPPFVNLRRELHKEMWSLSARLGAVPAQFDNDKLYRIKLARAVTPPDHDFPLRPSQDVLVRGHVANAIREHITGATLVGEK